jgi:hypothetical protein
LSRLQQKAQAKIINTGIVAYTCQISDITLN